MRAPAPAPDPGIGIATMAIKSIAPYLLNLFVCSFWVFEKSFSKNLSRNLNLGRKKFSTGMAIARNIAGGMIVPGMAKSKMEGVDMPNSYPSGMASFSSIKGIVAVKNTINS